MVIISYLYSRDGASIVPPILFCQCYDMPDAVSLPSLYSALCTSICFSIVNTFRDFWPSKIRNLVPTAQCPATSSKLVNFLLPILFVVFLMLNTVT